MAIKSVMIQLIWYNAEATRLRLMGPDTTFQLCCDSEWKHMLKKSGRAKDVAKMLRDAADELEKFAGEK